MKRKSLFHLLTLLLVFSLVLSACGGGNNSGNTGNSTPSAPANDAKEEPKKEVTFTLAYATGDPATKQAIESTLKKFTDANPHIKIVNYSEVTSASYLDWLKTKDAVNQFPDLVEMRDTQLFADAGKIVELPDELKALYNDLPEVNGKVYNAPLQGVTPQGIIYSKKAYEDAGITELPKTYDEFLEVQEKLKASGITPIVVGGKDIWHMGFWINKFLIDNVFVNDPDWNSKRTAKTASFTDEAMVQAITDYKHLFSNYVDKGWLSTADNQTVSVLISGKAAQLFSGTWMFGQIEEADPNFEYGFYAVPDRQGNRNVVGLPTPGGWSLSTAAAADPDKTAAIIEFVKFFFEKEQYEPYLKTINSISATKENIVYESTPQMQGVMELMGDPSVKKSLMINQFWGDNLIPPQFRNWFYKLLQELVIKDGDVVEYMKQADTEYDNQVKANAQ
ncbi:ABC transporter substrate-binding protein [Paenibacillus tarimensis]